jgi:hypothetical protein
MKPIRFFVILAFLALMGCGTLEIGVERGQPATAIPASLPASVPTLSVAPLPTEVPSPTSTPSLPIETVPPPTEIPALLPATDGPQFVKIYLIAIDDNGQSGQLIGCGDSGVAVDVEIQPTQEVLRASLEKLLSTKDQFYGQSGLYNALYQSDLQIDSISLQDGTAVIDLAGTIILGGVCDNPRAEAQLESTVLQFSTVQEVSIFVNGRPLQDVLSLK